MGRALKILFSIIGLMVLLGVIGIVTVMLMFDVNDHRDEIELVVEKNTGRELIIDGDIGLAVAGHCTGGRDYRASLDLAG